MLIRKIDNENDARSCLAQAAASGLPRARWAQMHGIDARSLHAWHLNLNRHRRVTADFLELISTPADRHPTATAPSPSVLRVRRGDVVVEVPEDFDDEQLVRVLRAFAAC